MNTATAENECDEEVKPEISQPCNQPACRMEYMWFANPWGPVSTPLPPKKKQKTSALFMYHISYFHPWIKWF